MQTSRLAEEKREKIPEALAHLPDAWGVILQDNVGKLLLSKPQFGKMEMGLSQWERGAIGFSYPPQSAWQL